MSYLAAARGLLIIHLRALCGKGLRERAAALPAYCTKHLWAEGGAPCRLLCRL